jgi:acyl-CoA thioesterase
LPKFDDDIAVTKQRPGVYAVEIRDNWNVQIGPNGGYIAAILLNGMQSELNDSSRSVRGVTFNFVSASKPGAARIEVSIEKLGRSIATASGRLLQGDRTIAIALATFAPHRSSTSFREFSMPQVPGPLDIGEDCWMGPGVYGHMPFRDHYDQRIAIGPVPPGKSDIARVGGWTRLKDLRPFDALSLVAISDSWYPSMFVKDVPPLSAPTIDHTVHFFCDSPCQETSLDSYVLVEFETRLAQAGYLQEDGRIWAASGELLVQSRQLALILDAI